MPLQDWHRHNRTSAAVLPSLRGAQTGPCRAPTQQNVCCSSAQSKRHLSGALQGTDTTEHLLQFCPVSEALKQGPGQITFHYYYYISVILQSRGPTAHCHLHWRDTGFHLMNKRKETSQWHGSSTDVLKACITLLPSLQRPEFPSDKHKGDCHSTVVYHLIVLLPYNPHPRCLI